MFSLSEFGFEAIQPADRLVDRNPKKKQERKRRTKKKVAPIGFFCWCARVRTVQVEKRNRQPSI